MATYPIEKAGVNLTATYVSAGVAPFSLGTTVRLNDGGQAVLVCSSTSAVSTFAAVAIKSNYKVDMLTTTNAAQFKSVAFAQTSIATGYCGWVQFGGRPKVNLATNCTGGATALPLYTTATAGVLDDATISGVAVLGITAKVSISNATATTIVCAMVPMIGSGAVVGV